jgi:hypothetical protein
MSPSIWAIKYYFHREYVVEADQRNDGKRVSTYLPHRYVVEADQRNDGKRVST